MDGTLAVVLISVAMFLGCFILGFIPLLMKLSEERLRLVSILGAGLLCGTALAIIIPEGVDLLKDSGKALSCQNAFPDQNPTPLQKFSPVLNVTPVQNTTTVLNVTPVQNTTPVLNVTPVQNTTPLQNSSPVQNVTPVQKTSPLQNSSPVQNVTPVQKTSPVQNLSEAEGGLPPRFLTGMALVVGFMLMFVVDQIASGLSFRDPRTGLPSSTSITATLGLVIHAAADGCALGAAMASPVVSVQVLVFFAVILHKAPAAFGLVSFLMHAGLQRKQITIHLLVFSAAAPVLTIVTFGILIATGGSAQSRLTATGVGMLFSAGTFLYVATVHVLPEVSTRSPSPHLHNHSQTGSRGNRTLGLLESITLSLGAGLPVLLAYVLQDD